MKNDDFNYDENLIHAKQSTVYAHAIVWIKDVLENSKTDRRQFEEIKKIVDEAAKHLKG